jgi:hypothetical protein
MKQRGRQTGNQSSVVPLFPMEQRIQPPSYVSAKEARLFNEVVTSVAPRHFVPMDADLIVAYVHAVQFERKFAAAKKTDPDAFGCWVLATKTQSMLARALRLTPRSRITPRTAGRMAGAQRQSRPWEEPSE